MCEGWSEDSSTVKWLEVARVKFRLGWTTQCETTFPKVLHFLTSGTLGLLNSLPSSTVCRHRASRTSRTGSNTSGRWSRSAPSTWEERSRSPFIFQKQLQPSTTRDEGKHTPLAQTSDLQREQRVDYTNISLLNWSCVCVSVRDGEDLDSQGEGSSQPDTISLASRTSQNTLDSDKVRICAHWSGMSSVIVHH